MRRALKLAVAAPAAAAAAAAGYGAVAATFGGYEHEGPEIRYGAEPPLSAAWVGRALGALDVPLCRWFTIVRGRRNFSEGWGNVELARAVFEGCRADIALADCIPQSEQIEWAGEWRRDGATWRRAGSFRSLREGHAHAELVPAAALPELQHCHFELVLPAAAAGAAATGSVAAGSVAAGAAPSGAVAALAFLLPSSADCGFEGRYRKNAVALADAGVGSVILEAPFCGARRAASKPWYRGAQVERVSDVITGGLLLMHETLFLRRKLEEVLQQEQQEQQQQQRTRWCVAGISSGGYYAALIACVWPRDEPIAVVPTLVCGIT